MSFRVSVFIAFLLAGQWNPSLAGDTCEQLVFSGLYDRIGNSPGFGVALYELGDGGDLGLGGPQPDRVELQIFGSGYNATGTFDLAAGGNENFETCTHCVLLIQDEGGGDGVQKFFFQSAGTLTVGPSTPAGPSPVLDVSFSGLRVEEVTIDDLTQVSTPVPGGDCYRSLGLFSDGFEG